MHALNMTDLARNVIYELLLGHRYQRPFTKTFFYFFPFRQNVWKIVHMKSFIKPGHIQNTAACINNLSQVSSCDSIDTIYVGVLRFLWVFFITENWVWCNEFFLVSRILWKISFQAERTESWNGIFRKCKN